MSRNSIGCRRALESSPGVVGEEREVLDARAVVLAQVLVDLALFLVVPSLIGMQKLPHGERSAYEVRPVLTPRMSKCAPR
jgi:hypothetical protein